MTYTLTPEEYQATLALDAEQRYEHFLQQVVENKEVWILKDDEGCMLLTADGDDCIPVWPHPDYAKAWAVDDWSKSQPFAVPLQVWFDRWVKGMEEDGIAVAVFPLQEEAGVIEESADVAASLQKKIAKQAHKHTSTQAHKHTSTQAIIGHIAGRLKVHNSLNRYRGLGCYDQAHLTPMSRLMPLASHASHPATALNPQQAWGKRT